MFKQNKRIMKTLEDLQNSMDFNGYSWFDYEAYKSKSDKPCFIAENSDSVDDVETYNSLFIEALETIKTKEFLLGVCENYDAHNVLKALENVDESTIDFEDIYLEVTDETPEKFAESFMDNYFLGGDEVWCSLSIKLQDYMM